MSRIILQRNDKSERLKSYTEVYDIKFLSSIDKKYHHNILRIIKKSILGINFYHIYKKKDILSIIITKFCLANICLLVPNLFFNNDKKVEEIEITEKNEVKKKYSSDTSDDYLHKLIFFNFFDIGTYIIVLIFFKYREKKINNYMEILTQRAINQENDLIKDKYICDISKDGNYNIEIKKNTYIKKKTNDIIFFNYVINIPNISKIYEFFYDEIFSEKESEIIKLIITVDDALDLKYKKKLIFAYASILIFVLAFGLLSEKKNLIYIIWSLTIFYQVNIFFDNKNELINFIQKMNLLYIQEGYYIYANRHIISIFYLKEEYKANGTIQEINKLNKKLKKTVDENYLYN